ncbi:MAG: DUF3105 domain-containing protein [Alphaproteobacteria bacterium]
MAFNRFGHATWACGAIAAIMLAGGTALAQQEPLAGVKTLPDQGQQHENGPVDYGTSFPTSGAHSPTPVPPGFYTDRPPSESLVHSLEHGNIVIYYDQPGDAAITAMRDWAQQYRGGLDGVVVVRVRGIGPGVALTAWTKQLFQHNFDETAAFAFIDAFRGRGPERSVR